VKRAIWAAILGGVALALILSISPSVARKEAAPCGAGGGLPRFEAASPPKPVPDEPLLDGAGKEVRLAAFRGKLVVLNFWATWCAPCIKEMPALDRLQAALGPEGVEVVAASEDRGPAAEKVGAFYAERGIRHLKIYVDPKGNLAQKLGVRGLPTTILIDPEGREVGRLLGVAEWDGPEAATELRACLARRPQAT
jgi:thiol-disulfide isomerase/thioredoxin